MVSEVFVFCAMACWSRSLWMMFLWSFICDFILRFSRLSLDFFAVRHGSLLLHFFHCPRGRAVPLHAFFAAAARTGDRRSRSLGDGGDSTRGAAGSWRTEELPCGLEPTGGGAEDGAAGPKWIVLRDSVRGGMIGLFSSSSPSYCSYLFLLSFFLFFLLFFFLLFFFLFFFALFLLFFFLFHILPPYISGPLVHVYFSYGFVQDLFAQVCQVVFFAIKIFICNLW